MIGCSIKLLLGHIIILVEILLKILVEVELFFPSSGLSTFLVLYICLYSILNITYVISENNMKRKDKLNG